MSKKHLSLILKATDLAENSRQHFRHGAIVVKNGKILGKGWNKSRNSPAIIESGHRFRCGVHAEVDALRSVKDARGSTVYVGRINRRGEIRMSRPCKLCRVAIAAAGVKRVIYTIYENEYGVIEL